MSLSGIFGQPFPEQLAAFRLRLGNLVPTRAWDDISRAAHDRAFMVAGAMKADLLADLAQAVDKSIAEGRSLEEFRRDFRSIVEKHGWHGWTGEDTEGGRAWRTRVIYKTNARVSYAAGRLAQLRNGGFSWWVYFHGGSLDPRIIHLSWNGLALRPDHPFWQKHYPPNDWGCSCYVSGARSREGVKRLGGDPDKELEPGWDAIDRKTGLPQGLGKGWDYAPGASVSDTVTELAPKLETLPERPAIDLIQSWLTEALFGAWMKNPVGLWPLARIPQKDAEKLGSQKLTAHISPRTMKKQDKEHPELLLMDYLRIQPTVSEATEILFDGHGSVIYVLEDQEFGGHVLVVSLFKDGDDLKVASFRRLPAAAAKRDAVLARLRRRNQGK